MLLEVNLNSINLSKISKMTKKQITELSYQIVGHAITVHKQLGPRLLESVYEECLKYELEKHGHLVRQQINVPVVYDELIMDVDLRLDLLVDNLIVVELKAVENVLPVAVSDRFPAPAPAPAVRWPAAVQSAAGRLRSCRCR